MAPKKPQKRIDCINGPRPCPWISCKHHMLWAFFKPLKMSDDSILELMEKLPETCTLDAAENGPLTLEEVGSIFGITRERVRQIEGYVGIGEKKQNRVMYGAIGKLRKRRYAKLLEGYEDISAYDMAYNNPSINRMQASLSSF